MTWSRITHSSHFATDLLADARIGGLVLPSFQRPFVWDEPDVLALLDSALRGFPVGTLLLWGSWWRGARVSPGRCRSFAGCAGPAAQATLVLDGQQRVQALLNASAPDSRYVWDAVTGTFFVGEANPMCGLIPARWLFERNYRELQEMYTFCDASERVAKKAEVLYQSGPRKGMVKGWADGYSTIEHPRSADQERVHGYIESLDQAYCAVRDLRIGSIIVPEDASLDFARETFRRCNTTGKPFTEADVFAALEG